MSEKHLNTDVNLHRALVLSGFVLGILTTVSLIWLWSRAAVDSTMSMLIAAFMLGGAIGTCFGIKRERDLVFVIGIAVWISALGAVVGTLA